MGIAYGPPHSGKSFTWSTELPLAIANGRPYTVRIRLGDDHRKSLDAIENTVFNSSTGQPATIAGSTEVSAIGCKQGYKPSNPTSFVCTMFG